MDAITEESASGLVFNFPDDDTESPTSGTNLDAARTNAFFGEFANDSARYILISHRLILVSNTVHVCPRALLG